jgi:3-dehydroquinate synthase
VRVLEIHGVTGDSKIIVGGHLSNLSIPTRDAFIITDTTVRHYYQKDFPPFQVIEIPTGENTKNFNTVKEIYEQLLRLEADRSSFIVGIGGGVVCDIVGFVASTYLRGLQFGLVPSTLLSQVDAGVGGKNGVNLGGYKNLVGTFNQPEFVICDTNLLETLPQRELLSGFAEILKHAVIGNADLFSYLEGNREKALNLDSEVIENLIYDSLVVKTSIVNGDEKEKGERRKLNFGHTFGHAIEKTMGISHGEAVSAGMVIASEISRKRVCLSAKDTERIEALIEQLKLPARLRVNRKSVLDALRKDKKRKGESLHFVLLKSIGNAVVEEIPMIELEAMANEII